MKRWVLLAFAILISIFSIIVISFITGKVFWLFSIMYFIGTYYTIIALFGVFWDHSRPEDDPHYRPFVTVMIPAKNEENVITKTLDDLLEQD